jgi:iron(II)-dependent oxidoreductase
MRSIEDLAASVRDARRRTLDLTSDWDGSRPAEPRLAIVNPGVWELGHVGWFQERWVLRHAAGRPPLRADADRLWDSSAVAHDTRWDLPLPSLDETRAYLADVEAGVLELLQARPSEAVRYFGQYSVLHEDMHGEAFTYTRQTLAQPPPPVAGTAPGEGPRGPWPGDVTIPGGRYGVGAERGEGFVFDNEKWAHPVALEPFRIAKAPVTAREFAAFVDAGGYATRALWSEGGWSWRAAHDAQHPVYWRRASDGWERRDFDRWVALEPDRPVLHVNWFEAEAWCAWAGRRLPTEAEWECAAAHGPDGGRRRFPWGDAAPTPAHANLDGRARGCADVAAHPAGDSAWGCRQMIGNVWEWTATAFGPYPGFEPDAYRDYSLPWFGTHKVLRGGAWTTRARLLRNTWRNFYTPDRRDVLAGFRTCAR